MDPTWFERGVRPDSVSSALRRDLPELRSGTVDLVDCRVTRLRSSEDGEWTATYLFEVADPTDTRRTVSAHGTLVPDGGTVPPIGSTARFGEDGWSHWLPDLRLHLNVWAADAALPGLHAITQERTALPLLQQLLEAHRPTGGRTRLVGCETSVLTYKAGLRATVSCDLTVSPSPSPGAWPRTVVAKVHRVDDGRACHDVLEALWASPMRDDESLRIPEPVGYVDDLGISVQTHLDHARTLKDLLADAFTGAIAPTDAVRAVDSTARGLATLHTSGVATGGHTTWAGELAALERKRARLTALLPWLDTLTGTVLTRIGRDASLVDPDPAVPSHGSLRPAQVLVLDAGGLGLIDFDKAGQAEPARDIAMFLVKLRHSAVNKTGGEVAAGSNAFEERSSHVDVLADAFLAAYREQATVTEERVRVWEALELCSLVLSAARKMLPDRAATCAAMLVRHLTAHVVAR
jgi:hypothetical protein